MHGLKVTVHGLDVQQKVREKLQQAKACCFEKLFSS
jgi:hypothetical protein